MKNIILILTLMFFPLYLNAQTVFAKYKVTYGNFLRLGEAYTTLTTNDNQYTIKIEARTKGMAKFLSRHRVETYESQGEFVEGRFIPYTFIKTREDNRKKEVIIYTFDRENQKIHVDEYKGKNNSNLTKEPRPHAKIHYDLDYFASDDLLSLFFNLQSKMLDFKQGDEHVLKAVGANKTKGKISVLIPAQEKMKSLEKVLKTDSKIKFIAYINQKIFSSKRGELMISLNDSGFCNKAVLKDVLLFGDIVGEMKEFKIIKE